MGLFFFFAENISWNNCPFDLTFSGDLRIIILQVQFQYLRDPTRFWRFSATFRIFFAPNQVFACKIGNFTYFCPKREPHLDINNTNVVWKCGTDWANGFRENLRKRFSNLGPGGQFWKKIGVIFDQLMVTVPMGGVLNRQKNWNLFVAVL